MNDTQSSKEMHQQTRKVEAQELVGQIQAHREDPAPEDEADCDIGDEKLEGETPQLQMLSRKPVRTNHNNLAVKNHPKTAAEEEAEEKPQGAEYDLHTATFSQNVSPKPCPATQPPVPRRPSREPPRPAAMDAPEDVARPEPEPEAQHAPAHDAGRGRDLAAEECGNGRCASHAESRSKSQLPPRSMSKEEKRKMGPEEKRYRDYDRVINSGLNDVIDVNLSMVKEDYYKSSESSIKSELHKIRLKNAELRLSIEKAKKDRDSLSKEIEKIRSNIARSEKIRESVR